MVLRMTVNVGKRGTFFLRRMYDVQLKFVYRKRRPLEDAPSAEGWRVCLGIRNVLILLVFI